MEEDFWFFVIAMIVIPSIWGFFKWLKDREKLHRAAAFRKQEAERRRPHVKKLDELGLYRFVAESDRDIVMEEAIETGWLFEETGRCFMADSEDLAEQGVADFLKTVGHFLKREGILLLFEDDDDPECEEVADLVVARVEEFIDEEAYTVSVGEREYQIWHNDLHHQYHWGSAALAVLELLNDLMAAAGSSEKAYGYGGGNGFNVIFMEPRQMEFLREKFPELCSLDELWDANEIDLKNL